MSFAERLKSIREEMGLSLEKFAQLGGVQARTQIYYEKSERYPTVEYLLKLSDEGIDVSYLVIGSVSQEGLSNDERELLTAYRDSSSEKKYALMLMARTIEKKSDDEGGISQSDSEVVQKVDNELSDDNVSSYKKADRIRNFSSMKKVVFPLFSGALFISICLILFGEYSYLLSEDPLKANILSLVLFSIVSIGIFGVGIIYAEKVFNVKDSNTVRMRQIKSLFISK